MPSNRHACDKSIKSLFDTTILHHKCCNRQHKTVSGQYLNDSFRYKYFCLSYSFQICVYLDRKIVWLSTEQKEGIKSYLTPKRATKTIDTETSNVQHGRSINEKLKFELDSRISKLERLSKAYRDCVYNTRYRREVNLCFIALLDIIDQKEYSERGINYIQDKKEELITDFCFHMDMAKVRFSRFVGADIS